MAGLAAAVLFLQMLDCHDTDNVSVPFKNERQSYTHTMTQLVSVTVLLGANAQWAEWAQAHHSCYPTGMYAHISVLHAADQYL